MNRDATPGRKRKKKLSQNNFAHSFPFKHFGTFLKIYCLESHLAPLYFDSVALAFFASFRTAFAKKALLAWTAFLPISCRASLLWLTRLPFSRGYTGGPEASLGALVDREIPLTKT